MNLRLHSVTALLFVSFTSPGVAQWLPYYSPSGCPMGCSVAGRVGAGASTFCEGMPSGFFLTTDNGRFWRGLGYGPVWSQFPGAVYRDPNSPGVMMNSVFLSANNGASWTLVNGAMPNLRVRAISPGRTDLNGKGLLAATPYGVFRSAGEGKRWSSMSLDMLPDVVLLFLEFMLVS